MTTNWEPMSKEEFKLIIEDIVSEMLVSQEELMRKYAADPENLMGVIQSKEISAKRDNDMYECDYKDVIQSFRFGCLPHTFSKHIIYPAVLGQTSSCLCGFHAFFNAK